MSGLTARQVLSAWEQGAPLDPVHRAVVLWRQARPDQPEFQLWDAPVGERDAALMQLRTRTFGAIAECLARCPRCEEAVELSLDLRELTVQAPQDAPPPWSFDAPSGRVGIRPVSSRDLQRAARGEVQDLLDCCVVEGSCGLTDADRAAIEAELERRDPQAEISLALTCPACDHGWEMLFDIAGHLWSDIEAEARGLLDQVDLLARVYHWSEADVLDMPPGRRRAYLERAAR